MSKIKLIIILIIVFAIVVSRAIGYKLLVSDKSMHKSGMERRSV